MVAGLALFTGCEGWQFGGAADSWNESGGWGDVSGLYLGAAGDYLVSNYSNLIPASTNAITTNAASMHDIGTTVNGQTAYSGQITELPLVPGSITFFVGAPAVTLVGDASGTLDGGANGSGTINYDTGAYSITLTAAPVGGQPIQAVFSSTSGGEVNSGGGMNPGGSSIITAFNVEQSGNHLKIIDNNGSIYQGQLGLNSTNSLGGTNMTALSATYSFEASGVSAAGFNVEMVGTFLASGNIGGSAISNVNIITIGTVMEGTWLEQGGKVGHIHGIQQ